MFRDLSQSYDIRLCCDDGIEDQPVINRDSSATGRTNCYVRVRLGHDQCQENRLILQEKDANGNADSLWIHIRACPPGFKSESGVCESFLSGERCHERNRCPFPHSTVEKDLWTRYFNHTKNGSSVEAFVGDICNSSLRLTDEVERMWPRLKKLSAVEFKVICRECWKKGKGEIAVKRAHAPECQNGHHWNEKSKKLVLDVGDERILDLDADHNDDWTEKECIAVEAIRECRKRLIDLQVTDAEFISEVKRWRQQEEKMITVEQKQVPDVQSENLFHDDGDSTKGSYRCPSILMDNESQIDVEEDISKVYDDDDLDDTMTVCTSDLDSSDDEAYAEDPYYKLESVTEAREWLVSFPDQYKRCTIHLDGPFNAKCRMLDEGFRVPRVPTEDLSANSEGDDVIREVEIRGRANCGPCFSGDEVVVELKKTKELDGDKIIYRGTVIAVLAKKILRKAYTFVCQVDTYHSHLMKPLDGIAPKIHVVNSVLKERYASRKDELVAVYSMVDKQLKLQKIVELDPRRRRDMLFVVRYIHYVSVSSVCLFRNYTDNFCCNPFFSCYYITFINRKCFSNVFLYGCTLLLVL